MQKLTTEEFVNRARAVHGNTYDYSLVQYEGMEIPVKIICRRHGEFKQTPNNHLHGHGCSICTRIEGRKLSLSEFIQKAQCVHGGKYDYSEVMYVNSKTNVRIVCPVHGVFEQTPNKHLQGQGCPKCQSNYALTKESFIEKANAVHHGIYDYSKVEYINSMTKVCIIDPDYGEFWQKPNAHLRGEGHPKRKSLKCYITKRKNHSFHVSRQEKIVYQTLCDIFGEADICREYKSVVYPFACDFYIKSLDLYMELNIHVTHGGHWFDENNLDDMVRLRVLQSHESPRNMYHNMIKVWTKMDLEKRDTAIRNKLNYVVFWYEDLQDFFAWCDTVKSVSNL